MKLLTSAAVLVCDHVSGIVGLAPTQEWVRVGGVPLLVRDNPERRTITGCTNYGATIKPCVTTLAAQAGYSTFVRIGGCDACLDTVTGLTDGTPPGIVKYAVRNPGQHWVGASS
jgi:hypothetical protein